MAPSHTVRQGESITSIAARYGLSPESVWEAVENRDLKELRGDPNVLAPGDVVVIPDKRLKEEDGATEKRHRFRKHGDTVPLRIRLRDVNDQPVAGAEVVLTIDGLSHTVTSDGDGTVEVQVAADARQGTLTLGGVERELRIGHLDPVDGATGQGQRLANLGYGSGGGEPDATRLLAAVEEFQCDQGLHVDGICGPKTQKRLREVYGC